MRNKMTTLSPETHKIASSMGNFSGWLRARLRQYDEGIDLVSLETSKDYIKLQLKNLTTVVNEHMELEDRDIIWTEWNKLMTQKKLGDFE